MGAVLNPFNKLDFGRLTAESGITSTDLLPFGDVSAASPNTRSITVQQFQDYLLPLLISSITPTGLVVPYAGVTAPSYWVLASGRTIGSASSGATERANSDTLNLYTLIWNSWSNTEAIIETSAGAPTTRGASAAADFAANKRLPVPDLRGRAAAGKDNMGGTSANRITSAGAGFDGDVLGAYGGSETHTLTIDEIPAHDHDVDVPTTTATSAATGADVSTPGADAPETSTSEGGGDPHQNTQPTIILTYLVKL